MKSYELLGNYKKNVGSFIDELLYFMNINS